MIVINTSKDRIIISRGLKRSPNHFKWLLAHSLVFVLVINSCKPPSIETHLTKKSSLSRLMPEWINMPASGGYTLFAKVFEQELVTNCHLIYYIFIIGSSFIVHAPTTIHKFNLAIIYQFSHLVLSFFRRVYPPSEKIGSFYLNEFPCWIL